MSSYRIKKESLSASIQHLSFFYAHFEDFIRTWCFHLAVFFVFFLQYPKIHIKKKIYIANVIWHKAWTPTYNQLFLNSRKTISSGFPGLFSALSSMPCVNAVWCAWCPVMDCHRICTGFPHQARCCGERIRIRHDLDQDKVVDWRWLNGSAEDDAAGRV